MINEKHFIKLRDEIELHARIEEVGSSIWLIGVHGIGEHLGRHNYLGKVFSGRFNILQYDIRGHGLSGGRKAYVNDFWDYMRDLEEVLIFLKTRYKMKKFVLFGHSMGGLITSGFLQMMAHKDLYPELFFINAPPVGFPGIFGKIIQRTPRSLFSTLASIQKSAALPGLVDLKYLSHDVRVKESYYEDSQNCLSLHSKLLLELVKASNEIFARPLKPRCPSYVTIGSEDRIIGVEPLMEYFRLVEKSFHLKEFVGAYHEIHNEIERYRTPYLKFLDESISSVL